MGVRSFVTLVFVCPALTLGQVDFGGGTVHRNLHRATDVAILDWNQDGHQDVVAGQYAAGEGDDTARVTLFVGNGRGGFEARHTLATGIDASHVHAVDWDRDGVCDLVCGFRDTRVLLNDGEGGVAKTERITSSRTLSSSPCDRTASRRR